MSQNLSPVSPDIETARIGYQTAVGLSTFYAQMVWAIFNAMVVANSIVVAGIVILATQPQVSRASVAFLGVAGLALCAVWATMSVRAHEYAAYYVHAARELEENHLSPVLHVLAIGRHLSAGEEVKLHPGNKVISMRFSSMARSVTGRASSNIVVIIFCLIYCFLIWHGGK